jgi:hypothetical protein
MAAIWFKAFGSVYESNKYKKYTNFAILFCPEAMHCNSANPQKKSFSAVKKAIPANAVFNSNKA